MSDTAHRVGTLPDDPTQPLEPELSLGDLLGRLSTDFGDLIVTHVELAKTELREEATKAGRGFAMMAAAALGVTLALLLLSLAAAWGLDDLMPRGVAFLIVGAVWALIAAALFARGKRAVETTRAIPETKASVQEDIAWAKQQRS